MRIVARMTQTVKKPDYRIPTTNAQGLSLLWSKIYPAELARQLGISRAAAGKWTEVPVQRVNDVAKITKIPRDHLLPEIFAPIT